MYASTYTISWLHLSDLRFSREPEAVPDAIRNALLRDVVRGLSGRGLSPDLVLVSGDIARSGDPAEYMRAHRFFDRLADATGLDPARHWFLAPGDHDVDPDRISPVAEALLASIRDEPGLCRLLEDPAGLKLFSARQHAFFEFTRAFLGSARAWSETSPWRGERLRLRGTEVEVLQLNSSWSARGAHRDRGQLMLGLFQIRRVLAQLYRQGQTSIVPPVVRLRLALCHHPLIQLREQDARALETLLVTGGVHFMLRGHCHGDVPREGSFVQDGLRTFASSGIDGRGGLQGVNLVRLDLERGWGELHAWQFCGGSRGGWEPAATPGSGRGMLRFPLPEELTGCFARPCAPGGLAEARFGRPLAALRLMAPVKHSSPP